MSLYRTHIRDSTYGMGCTSKSNSPLNMAGPYKPMEFLLGQVKSNKDQVSTTNRCYFNVNEFSTAAYWSFLL